MRRLVFILVVLFCVPAGFVAIGLVELALWKLGFVGSVPILIELVVALVLATLFAVAFYSRRIVARVFSEQTQGLGGGLGRSQLCAELMRVDVQVF